jgi:hypothetical protein
LVQAVTNRRLATAFTSRGHVSRPTKLHLASLIPDFGHVARATPGRRAQRGV